MAQKVLTFVGIVAMLAFLLGCSAVPGPTVPCAAMPQRSQERSACDWTWGYWMFHFSESHDSVEAIPLREASWHINVLKFVEKEHCLQIGQPIPQVDGTVKLNVILSHPFPSKPRYTGFDVRGIVIFPATRYWGTVYNLVNGYGWELWQDVPAPLYFSWTGDGGCGLLNDDGASFYYWPGFDLGYGYELPMFRYQKGKYASDDVPDSTVNPYLDFNDGSERRMFKTTDIIQRTYHFQLSPGAVSFAYVVLASWTPPSKLPVTDPALDFPGYANSETAVDLTFEQYAPIDPNGPVQDAQNIFAKATFKIYPHVLEWDMIPAALISPDILYWIDPPDVYHECVAYIPYNDYPPIEIAPNVYETHLYCALPNLTNPNPYVNGIYPALFMVCTEWQDFDLGVPTMMQTIALKIVEADLQASDG
jgi:hypothetical protein